MNIIRIISGFSSILEDKFSPSTSYKFQLYLLNAGVKLYIYDLISIIIFISLIFTLISFIFIILLNLNLFYIFISLLLPSIIYVFIISFKTEKRR